MFPRIYMFVCVEEGMGGHSESSGAEKKSSDAMNEIPTFNAENLQTNMKTIYYRFL